MIKQFGILILIMFIFEKTQGKLNYLYLLPASNIVDCEI